MTDWIHVFLRGGASEEEIGGNVEDVIRISGDKKRKRFNLFGNWDFVTLGLVSTFFSLYSFP